MALAWAAMAAVRFEHVSKQYVPDVYALAGLNLGIESGEIVSIVGPSGCGKTTALRILAGLETATYGHVMIDDEVVDNVPTHSRGLGMVTQDNALLRHRTTARNISMPLELRRTVDGRTVDEVVAEIADDLAIGHLLRRKPAQLSGGEIQAVQIARALISLPRVWLLDEPMARLDRSLRLDLRGDIRRLQRFHDVTTLLVTADQNDASVLSDRIAMLLDGRLQQVDTPSGMLATPVNMAVARFFGEPTMNFLTARVSGSDRARHYHLLGMDLPAWPEVTDRFLGRDIVVGIRPHELRTRAEVPGAPTVVGRVDDVSHFGSHCVARVDTEPGQRFEWMVVKSTPRPGDRVELVLEPDRFHLFDPLTEAAVHHPTPLGLR